MHQESIENGGYQNAYFVRFPSGYPPHRSVVLNNKTDQRHNGAKVVTRRLTFKEIECLCWCKEGKTNWEIAEIMSISEKTVEFHLSNTIRKLEVTNRITAVVKGIQRGIIQI
jgi:DNA-binding CsgD family transcriptional regulator